MILAIIIACEIGFWVAIAAGLATRYLLRRPRVGAVLLAMAPVIDLVLLTATAVDLSRGATASWHHGLAAIYLGFSIAYGHRMIAWADVRFAHRFASGPPPVRLTGRRHTLACWADVARSGLACAIAAAVVGALVLWVAAPERTAALESVFPLLGVVMTVELITAISYTLWPRPPAAA
ncbi:hypothetical protein [Mycetocola reblochoni]|uniref:Uncharacterized protein n=2 Tax=Mycetocola reblochoni TaxID=331618 RepID=A0A3L6ZU84_9MICO|nr:hypothetical protein [Mycetocola reblochoni]RLP71121.1 hypothetical protein D9V30_01510 [Mycetocola reblochoni]SJN35742.1 Putative membrane protein [Mycetocola reblochoni REB411]